MDKISSAVESMKIGEIGDRIVEVHESVTRLSYNLSADAVSKITVTMHDPNLIMHNNNYFMIGRTVEYLSQKFEIADVSVAHTGIDTVTFIARLQATQAMRRDKGQKSFPKMSPSEFASQMAAKFGLNQFIEDSPRDGTIVRESNDNKDESTFDVLQRLARDLDFRFFESMGTLFFASETYIALNQDAFTINVPSDENDAFFASKLDLKRSVDTKKGATAQASLLQNASSLSIYPGTSFQVEGVANFKGTFFVDKVSINVGPNAMVSISGTDIFDSADMACSLDEFRQGSRGDCVKRIQLAVGTKDDGIWGPITQRKVLAFQKVNNLPQDGIWNADDWAKLRGDFKRPSSVPVANPNNNPPDDPEPPEPPEDPPEDTRDSPSSVVYWESRKRTNPNQFGLTPAPVQPSLGTIIGSQLESAFKRIYGGGVGEDSDSRSRRTSRGSFD